MQGFDVKPAGRLEHGCDTPSARKWEDVAAVAVDLQSEPCNMPPRCGKQLVKRERMDSTFGGD